jgi:DNA-binding MarR family transcriptional regulator
MFFLKELPSRGMIEAYTSRYDGVDSETVADALHMMRRASLLIRRLEAYFAEHQLSQLRFLVLIVIDREPERTSLSPNEIAERLDVSRPVMTRTLKSLVDDALIETSGSDRDRRSKDVRLTDAGRKRLLRALPGYFALIMSFMKGRE